MCSNKAHQAVRNLSLNPFMTNMSVLYPLEKLKSIWFSAVFREYTIGTFSERWVNISFDKILTHIKLENVNSFMTEAVYYIETSPLICRTRFLFLVLVQLPYIYIRYMSICFIGVPNNLDCCYCVWLFLPVHTLIGPRR